MFEVYAREIHMDFPSLPSSAMKLALTVGQRSAGVPCNTMAISFLSSLFHRLRSVLLDILFPRRCVGCGTAGSHVCATCFASIPLLSKQYCPLCRRESLGGEVCQSSCEEQKKYPETVTVGEEHDLSKMQRISQNHWHQRYFSATTHLFFISLALERDFLRQRVKRIIEKKVPIALKSREPPFLDALIVGTEYQHGHILPKAIHRLKYTFDVDLAAILAEILIKQFHRHFTGNYYFEEWLATSVPLHSSREKWRGFNQAESLAIHFCQKVSLLYVNLLIRTKDTLSQAKLSRTERISNVRDAFSIVSGANIVGKNILLIDDVCATGSTLFQCAKILKRSGARNVTGLVLGRGF